MSDIKLDDARELLDTLSCRCSAVTSENWRNDLDAIRSIQDRTLETAAKLLEREGCCSPPRLIRSLKHKRVDEEKVKFTKELLELLRAARQQVEGLSGCDSMDHGELTRMIGRYRTELKEAGGEL